MSNYSQDPLISQVEEYKTFQRIEKTPTSEFKETNTDENLLGYNSDECLKIALNPLIPKDPSVYFRLMMEERKKRETQKDSNDTFKKAKKFVRKPTAARSSFINFISNCAPAKMQFSKDQGDEDEQFNNHIFINEEKKGHKKIRNCQVLYLEESSKEEKDNNFLTEPNWSPLIDLASQISKAPQKALDSWQKEHVAEFTSRFIKQSEPICLLELNKLQLNKTESDIIRPYCLSMIETIEDHLSFLTADFPGTKYSYSCGYLPTEKSGQPAPPLEQKVLVIIISHRNSNFTYPAIVIVPTGYLMHPEDYQILKKSLRTTANRWSHYEEFYGILTNFSMTIFMKYNRSTKKYYQWQYAVNFNECFLHSKAPDKLRNLYQIWFGMIYKAMQVHSEYIKSV